MPRRFAWGCCAMAGAMGLLPAAASRLPAQDTLPPWEGGLTHSVGQPPRTRFHVGASAGADWRAGEDAAAAFYGLGGIWRDLANPVMGALAASLEGYAGLRATEADGGLRALLHVPTLGLSAGADYNVRANRVGAMLALTLPVRRGGILGGGSLLRLEWNPGAAGAARASVLVPVGQRSAGRTRPHRAEVDLPGHARADAPPDDLPAGIDVTLEQLDLAGRRLTLLVVPPLDIPGADPTAALAPLVRRLREPPALAGVAGPGLQVDGTVRVYHAALTRAFAIAATGQPRPDSAALADGEAIAAHARAILLEHVLHPHNRLLGLPKSAATLEAFVTQARGNFAREIVSLTALPPAREAAVLHVFQRLTDLVLALAGEARTAWEDSRLIWLPLQLGLRPEEHDTQAELDRIVEAAVGAPLSDGNRVWYVINEQFHVEVARSVRAAESYHVLWIHDFRGRNAEGAPDASALRFVADEYLRALAARVRDYDRTRRLPVYMIFLDQHYYEANRGRLWMDVLERPLDDARLPVGDDAIARAIQAAQRDLREAVAGSRLLQAEGRQYGAAWLRNQVKVHVSITNPADPSFRAPGMLPIIGLPDNVMRDHRKIAFYDVTEEDPYRGLALYTGMGIGEHYTGPTWEDRAIMVQGPAVLSLKAQARQLLLSQGMAPEAIPSPLRARPLPEDYQALVTAEAARRGPGSASQRAMELHNLTGYLDKPLNTAKATLYSLMPPGAVVKVPDSLWGSSLYAALLTGSAFRGVRVLVVAPSLISAPSSGWPAMGLAHELFARLIVLQNEFGIELEAAGGMLKTGIYNPGLGVQEATARFGAAYRNARRTPFLRRLFPVHPLVDTLLAHAGDGGARPAPPIGAPRPPTPAPKLHLKASFFASREGWDSLMARPEVAQVLGAYFAQLARPGTEPGGARDAAAALAVASEQLVRAFEATLPPAQRERVLYYLLVGSANQDYRSMFMDGEASVLLAGWSGIVGLIDFALLINLSVWVDDLEMLDALLPAPSEFQRGAARWMRPLL